MQAIYAKRSNEFSAIKFGCVVQIVASEIKKGKNNQVRIEDSNKNWQICKRKDLYFPNHPQGYNQPCFKNKDKKSKKVITPHQDYAYAFPNSM